MNRGFGVVLYNASSWFSNAGWTDIRRGCTGSGVLGACFFIVLFSSPSLPWFCRPRDNFCRLFCDECCGCCGNYGVLLGLVTVERKLRRCQFSVSTLKSRSEERRG